MAEAPPRSGGQRLGRFLGLVAASFLVAAILVLAVNGVLEGADRLAPAMLPGAIGILGSVLLIPALAMTYGRGGAGGDGGDSGWSGGSTDSGSSDGGDSGSSSC